MPAETIQPRPNLPEVSRKPPEGTYADTLTDRYSAETVATMKNAVAHGRFAGSTWMAKGVDTNHRNFPVGYTTFWDDTLDRSNAEYYTNEMLQISPEESERLVIEEGVDELIRFLPLNDGSVAIGYNALGRDRPHEYHRAQDSWGRSGNFLTYALILPAEEAKTIAQEIWHDPTVAREIPSIAAIDKIGAQEFHNTMPYDKWAQLRRDREETPKTRFEFHGADTTTQPDIIDRPILPR